ncbi:MAG TPA: acid phosphatase [Candidatus Elarobacter sp.]|nr:acid phosphatase [Candidatus Elarobacter sp.]
MLLFARYARRFAAAALVMGFAGCSGSSNPPPIGPGPTPTPAPTATPTQSPTQQLQSNIKNVVVIYQENWSFDALYGSFPGANGLANASSTIPQIDKFNGNPITTLPQPLINGQPDPNFAGVKGKPVAPYSAISYIQPSQLTGDIVHRFYQEQGQIDGGKMDMFMSWSDNPGLLFSTFDATNMPEGQLAAQYTLADNAFHSAYGGSFLNHQYLICACAPKFPNAPSSVVATTDSTGTRLALDASGNIVHDGFVTPDGYAVNTSFSVNSPHPSNAVAAQLVPEQTAPTIGDRLSGANVSWKWYSGGWAAAIAGNPDPNFQFHHQAFAYYANYADGTPGRAAHLQDETNFLADLHNNVLPSVSFIKPIGENNEHPGYASLLAGQQHVLQLVQAIQSSPYWKNTAIIITYDENGGRWDHVSPPAIDRWGAGTRVPFIVISPWAKHGYVDHTQYETVSILALIEKLWNLQPLGTRDAAANPFSNAFDFTQVNPFAVKRKPTAAAPRSTH